MLTHHCNPSPSGQLGLNMRNPISKKERTQSWSLIKIFSYRVRRIRRKKRGTQIKTHARACGLVSQS